MILHNNTLNTDYCVIDNTFSQELYNFLTNIEVKVTHNFSRGYISLASAYDTESTNYLTRDGTKFPFLYKNMVTIKQGEKELNVVMNFLQEFEYLLQLLHDYLALGRNRWLVIFVHNYSFEHTFIYKYFLGKWGDIFCTKENTILYARLEQYNIEFRCSYLLTGYSLDKLPTKLKKLSGKLKYELCRIPGITPLTDEETAYCINDTRVLAEYIDEQLKTYTITNLPLTKTAFVRTGLANYIKLDKKSKEEYKTYLKNFIINDIHEYLRLKACFCGGHTSVNPHYSGSPFYNELIICFDFASSYPSVIVRFKFPSKLKSHEEKLSKNQYEILISKGYAVSASITFHNLRSKITTDSPIHLSQATVGKEKKEVKENNGKVVSAKQISIDCFELSYITFKKFYDWDSIEVEDAYVYEKDFLPKKVIEYVLQLYYNKTAYKDVEGHELEYRLAKELLNSIYGCGYTDPCKFLTLQTELGSYTNESKRATVLNKAEIVKKELLEKGINPTLENISENLVVNKEEYIETEFKMLPEKIKEYNRQLSLVRRCIPYQVGGYVSEIARYNLFRGIYAAGDDYIYSDTDSIFVRNPEKIQPFIDKYNTQVKEEMEYVMKMYNLPIDAWRPKAPNGEEKPLGYWDVDKKIVCFKALRSKCYMYVKKSKDKKTKEEYNEFCITIAGLGKEAGKTYLLKTYNENIEEIFNHFTDDMEIPAEDTGKLTHHIIYEQKPHTELVEDYEGRKAYVTSYGGTYLEPSSFSISLLDDYLSYIDELHGKQD